MHVIILILFLSALHLQHAVAEERPRWRSAVISNEQGLSNSAVNDIFRDSRGFMWFGTWDGLNRYDGKNIKTFYPDLYDDKAISSNIIRQMLEDEHGNFWIVTERGLNKYSHDLESFTGYFTQYPELILRERSLKAKTGYDGNIWVMVYGVGLFRHIPEDDDFVRVDVPCHEDREIKQMDDFLVLENRLYVLQGDSLFVTDHKRLTREESIYLPDLQDLLSFNPIEHNWFFLYDGEPFLLIALREGGMVLINLLDYRCRVFYAGEPEFRLTAFSLSLRGNYYWLGTDDGNVLQMFPQKDFLIQSVLHQLPELSGNRVKIWSIVETADDMLWIGTDGEGVFRVIQKPKPFFLIGRGLATDRQLNHQIVRAVYEDDDEGLWVGTRGNGLNYIPAGHGSTVYYNTSNGLTNNAVLALMKDNSGNLWIGHDGKGIDMLDPATGRFYHFPDDLQGGEHLEFGSVYAICIDAFGQVWLGTSGYGVIGLNVARNGDGFRLQSYKHIKSDGLHDVIKSNIVYAITEERPNILWLATRGAGIYRMNTLTGTLDNITQAGPDSYGLSDDDILSLHMGGDGILWVGTSGGLNQVNIDLPPYEIAHYTMRDGLPNNTIHAVLEDSEGNIWVSTNKGLSKFIRNEGAFLNFNVADGLQGNEYTDGAAHHVKSSGRFYFGGINGLNWFFPESINISERETGLLFTGLRLYNQKILPGDSTNILSKNINDLKEIVLKHHQNFFTIEYTTLNFVNPDKSLFEYKLENFNTDWVFAGNQREANFTNVPDGRYRLLLRSTNEDGIWSDDVKELAILIRPPFRKTWPAYLLYAFALAGLGYIFYNYQTNKIRQRQQRALEKMQQQKEKELHQYKLQFFTNLAHEFGTPLTLIFASAGSLLNPSQDPKESQSLVKTIYKNSRRMQKLIQELLEFRKIDTGREKVKLRRLEIIQAVNDMVNIFSHFAQENELELSFEPDEEELWLMFDSGKLEKIMLNLLGNAIKFTPPGGIVKVRLMKTDKDVRIAISDNGSGIAEDVLPYIFDPYYQGMPKPDIHAPSFKGIGIGLAYTKSLVELLGGEIHASSKFGEGSVFSVRFPYIAADSGKENEKTTDLLSSERLQKSLADEFHDSYRDANTRSNIKPALWTTPKKYRILVAEDDNELSGLLLKLLSEQYDVALVQNGTQALEVIEKRRIDIVVSDIIMPEMDGLTLCKTIKTDLVTSHIPVILLTARAEMENRIEGLEMGADSYIPKPFHPQHLFIRIEKLLKTREQFAESFKQHVGTPLHSIKQELSGRDKELLAKCVSYIEANCADESLDAERLASHMAFSKPQLYRKIKALTGLTPHGLIKNFRLKKARQMIAEDKYSITDIIYMTGFNNRTYFYRSYKEVFGETPGVMNKS